MGFNTIDLNKFNLDNDEDNFDDDDPEAINHVRLMTWCNRFKQRKACKKEIREELMLVAWHPTRRWDWCVSEDNRKGIE